MGPTSFEVDRATVDQHLQNMAELFTQIRAVPNLHDGKAEGFTLSEIEPGSIFQQMGLRNGDVVTSVDGQAMGDPARAMQLLNTLRNHQSITVQVMRGGRTLDLQYEIQ